MRTSLGTSLDSVAFLMGVLLAVTSSQATPTTRPRYSVAVDEDTVYEEELALYLVGVLERAYGSQPVKVVLRNRLLEDVGPEV